MLTDQQIKETATRLRQLASDPRLKRMFNSTTRKSFNDDANAIMAALATEKLRANLIDITDGIERSGHL